MEVMRSDRTSDEWISVKDRLPPQGVGVLCLCHRHPGDEKPWRYVQSCMLYDDDPDSWVEWYDAGKVLNFMFVTHWMPFPELPQ